MNNVARFTILAAITAALLTVAPAWAQHKCTGSNGKVIYQDTPCPSSGELVGDEIARRNAKKQQEIADALAEAAERRKREEERDKDQAKELAWVRAHCPGGVLQDYPKVGMAENVFLNCTKFGIGRLNDKVNESQSVGGTMRQYVYDSQYSPISYVHVHNGVVISVDFRSKQ